MATSIDPHYLSAEPAFQVEFFDAPKVPTIVQKFKDFPMAEMTAAFDSTLEALFPHLKAEGISRTGPVFALHHRIPGETANFEIGVPVDKPLKRNVKTDSGVTLKHSFLPGGRAARISVLGGYDGLSSAWDTFVKAVIREGKMADLPLWEVYVAVSSPDSKTGNLRTDLYTSISHDHRH
ncbi:GyrI-like domain-containing protein [Corynebacterium sp. A21]|uniref:GyrI-like domain-containing protein n=1 Tax=Corynebacterium sp. A21 TaxID=3457318 RepID=UPI003FD0DF9A